MTILIADNSPRISYTATSGQTAFTVPFEFFDNTDLNVYINDTLQTLTTHYTVTGGSGSTGSITLVTGATAGDIIVITRDVTLERTTDFPTSGPFQVASLNTELDKVVAMIADMKDLAERGLRLSDSDTTTSLTLASKDARKGTVLAFNETTGAVEIGPTIADTNSIAQIKADIALLADIQDGTVATNAITTVSSISSDVTTVSSNNANVTTVAGQTTNMQNITDNLTAVQNAATNATNAAASATAAASSATAAATSETNAGTSETNAATSATNASTSATAASTSATAAASSATAAASSETAAAASETAAATSETNAASSATTANSYANAAAISSLNAASSESNAAASATSASAAQTAAESARDSALASFDSFDDRYLGTKTSDPTVDNDGDALVAGALYFNSTDGEMKVYNGTSWVDAYADGASLVSKSGDTMTGDLSFGDNNKAIFGAGSDLQIYHDGSNSYVKDAGTGNLLIQADNFVVLETTAGVNYFQGQSGGASTIYHSGSPKLDTTSTGIDVTGTVTADGLTVDGTATIDGGSSANTVLTLDSSTANTYLKITDSNSTNGTFIGATTDDLNFYPNNALAAKFAAGGEASFYGDVRIYDNATDVLIFGSGLYQTIGGSSGSNDINYRTYANHIFKTGTGASSKTDGTERMRIDSSGNVGINTTSPSKTLELTSDGLSAIKINGYSSSGGLPLYTYNDSGGVGICTGDADSQGQGYANLMYLRDTDNSFNVYLGNAGAVTHRLKLESDGDLHVDGNVVAYSTTVSDIRLKKDIAPIEDAVTKVQQLNGCTFTYLKDDRKSAGLIAQDVEKVLPSAVIDDEAVFHGEEGETYKTVQYDQLIGLLVEAVKELKAEIEELKDASSK